jgi:hypothetical protein
MIRSSRTGLRCISVCPYQYVRGINALEGQTVGAVDADSPNGHADVEVDNGVDREVAEMLPGTDHAPCKMKDPSDATQSDCSQDHLHHPGLRLRGSVTTRHAPKVPRAQRS